MKALLHSALFFTAVFAVTLATPGSAAAACQPGGTGTVYSCCVTCTPPTPGARGTCTAPSGCNGNSGNTCGTTCVICGTSQPEDITGTTGKDVICADAGDDTIDAKGGDDIIDAGALPTPGSGSDNNTVDAGGGNDTVYGSSGDDVINGDDGNDTIYGRGGSDALYGDANTDTINQGVPTDREQPRDLVASNPANDFLYTADDGAVGFGRYLATSNWNVCGTSLTGISWSPVINPLVYFGFVSKQASGTKLLIKPARSDSASVGTEVNFVAPTYGLYTFEGHFARMSGCSSGNLIVAVDPGGFSATIGTSDFSEHEIDIQQLLLKQGDIVKFSVLNSVTTADDVATLDLTVTPFDVGGNPINQTLSSTLCGGSGNDALTASGPGHVCLSGGSGTGDTCTVTAFSVPSRSDRDVGTSWSDCETSTGTGMSGTRHPGCGCP